MSHWRTKSRSVIVAALKEADAAGLSGKAREKFVSDRYPFGERAMHPYKIWLSEFGLLVKGKVKPKCEKVEWPHQDLPGQGLLFNEANQ